MKRKDRQIRIEEGDAARRRLRLGIARSRALVEEYRRRLLLLRRALDRQGARAR